MIKGLQLALLVLVASSLTIGPASAGVVALMDYVGNGWETGGFPPSNPGDMLEVTAVVDALDPLFGVDLALEEVTIYITGLISTGGFLDPFGNTVTAYVGGSISVYADPLKDADWGIFPPNVQISTFTNGVLLFDGLFTDFTLTMTPGGFGGYDGSIDGVGGTSAVLCDDCAYTFGGAFGKDTGAAIPEGYDLQMDGTLEVDAAVSTTDVSFGAIKAIYNN